MNVLTTQSALADRLERPVRIASYDPGWAGFFAEEREVLEAAIGEWAPGGIHHVGSTAIPGVDAEPVVDILAGTERLPAPQECARALAQLGYALVAEEEVQAYCKPCDEGRCYDLYLVSLETVRYTQMLAFRDLLRLDRQRAIAYAGLKRDLARRYAGDRRGYTAAKGELVQAVLDQLAGSPLIAL